MTNRKRGGQPGNTNALKHGLYAARYTKAQRLKLKRMAYDDMRFEIAALRTIVDEILKQISQTKTDPDILAKLTNSLTNAMTTLSTLARTHALLNGESSSLAAAIEEALNDFDPFDTSEEHISMP